MGQVASVVVLVLLYAVVVRVQFTFGEWVLRPLGAYSFPIRGVLSVVHAVVGYGVLLGIGIMLSVIAHGDYRVGILGPYSYLGSMGGGLFGLLLPWLPLLCRQKDTDEQAD